MRLDPQNPPDPESTTLHLLVSQEGCASGMSGVERMPKPEVIESATVEPKSLRIPRPYRRNLVIYALAFALAVLAMARAAMAVRRWRRANAEVRRWRRARDHAS